MSLSFSAPAKVILLGEHAVVYGQPAIAVPLSDLRASVEMEESDSGLVLVAEDLNETIVYTPEAEHVLAQVIGLILSRLKVDPPAATLRLHSDIPIASGLGSGTAISTVLGRALSALAGIKLADSRLNDLVYDIEKLHHGTPSGIDNTVIVYEQPVYFRRGQPMEHLSIAEPFSLVVADTGLPASTKIAVGDVRRLHEEQPDTIRPLLEEIGQIVDTARTAMEQGDLRQLGTLMTRNHQFLRELTVSSPELDKLVDTANKAGAWGAKLSGGGRGGNMIALTSLETLPAVVDALQANGASRVFTTVVGAHPATG